VTITIRKPRGAGIGISVVTAIALAGCAQGSSSSGSGPTPAAAASSSARTNTKVILIGDQPFGDHGPMDDMAAGLATCASRYRLTTKKIVALSASDYNSSIRGAAQQGYGLIMTTFPQMATATAAVAAAFPSVKFAAIYQDINDAGKSPIANLWDTSFDVKAAAYVEGVMAARLSKKAKLGYIVGDLDPTISAELNAFIQGAKSVNASTQVYWANAGTFIDPAKGKDLAQSMISKGVDVLATAAGQTQLGALDAAKAAGILFFGDNGDNSASYPKGFVSDLRSELGKNVVDACGAYATRSFKGGTHTVYDLSNGGADLATKLVTKWGAASGQARQAASLVSAYNDLLKKISSGQINVPTTTTAPKSAG
jgi:basic membrane protein A